MSAPSFEVTTEVVAHLAKPGELVPVHVRLSWSLSDPFVVELRFRASCPDYPEVVWLVARDLLVRGARRAVGTGDVRVFPDCEHDGDLPTDIGVVLDNGQTNAEFWFDALELQLFLSNTMTRCPLGDEMSWVDLDAEIAALLDDPHGPWFGPGPGEVIA